ncbi:MAG: M64 family metallopeptidase, partial [Muribaculaceae bacterium]|nr:M64 family metallopeptidase [Muribaculaceae bacterium]
NITTSGTHPKWKHLVPAGTPLPTPAADADRFPVGAFEGCGYSSRGVFRPADHCRMRDNQTEGFCPVCQDAIARIIKFYTEENSDK